MSITEALEQIKKTDSERAFRYIYNTMYERIFRTSYFYVKDDERAREIAIDVFASLWNNRKTMIIPKDFISYCFIATKNTALNYLRNNKNNLQCELDGHDTSSDITPEQQVIEEELFIKYEEALYRLPERCRQIFTMTKEDGMSYAEVAKSMNISTKTVDAQIQKATKEIRNALKMYLNEPKLKSNHILSLL